MPLQKYIDALKKHSEFLSILGPEIILNDRDLSETRNQKQLTELIELLSLENAPLLSKLQLHKCTIDKLSALKLILLTKATTITLTKCTLNNEKAGETIEDFTCGNNTSCTKLVLQKTENLNYKFLKTILEHIPENQLIKFDISRCDFKKWYPDNCIKIKKLIQEKNILMVVWGELANGSCNMITKNLRTRIPQATRSLEPGRDRSKLPKQNVTNDFPSELTYASDNEKTTNSLSKSSDSDDEPLFIKNKTQIEEEKVKRSSAPLKRRSKNTPEVIATQASFEQTILKSTKAMRKKNVANWRSQSSSPSKLNFSLLESKITSHIPITPNSETLSTPTSASSAAIPNPPDNVDSSKRCTQ